MIDSYMKKCLCVMEMAREEIAMGYEKHENTKFDYSAGYCIHTCAI